MADIGVLNLQIKDNSEKAAGGLDQLTGALERVKQAVAGGFSLSTVSTAVTRLAQNIAKNNATPAIKNLTALFNALSQFKKLEGININVEPLKDLKQAIGTGFKVGQVGTQMEKLRGAFKDGFVSDEAIGSIEKLHRTIQLFSDGNDAKVVKDMANALGGYAEKAKQATSAVSDWRMQQMGMAEEAKEKTFEKIYPDLTRHGKKATTDTGENVAELQRESNELKKLNFADVTRSLIAGKQGEINQTVASMKELASAMKSIKTAAGSTDLAGYAEGLKKLNSAIDKGANSYKTLGRLVTQLGNLKEVSSGFRFPDVSRLESLARTLQENYNLETSLKKIAEGMEAVKAASNGFKMPSMKGLDQAMAAVTGSVEAVETGKMNVGNEAQQAIEEVHEKMNFSSEIQENTEAIATATQELVSASTESTSAVIQNAVEAEDEYAQHFEQILEEMKEQATECDAIRRKQEEQFYKDSKPVTYTLEQTNAMANELTQLDLLCAKLREAQRKYNEFVNKLGASDAKTVKAGLAIVDLKDKIWEYKNALESVNGSPIEDGVGKVTDYINASKIDLLTQKAYAMRDALAQDIEAGKLDEQQQIARAIQIQELEGKIENLREEEEKAEESTRSLTDYIRDLFAEAKRGSLGKFINQLARIAKYRFIRSIIKQITDGLREGTQNYYAYSKAIASSFAPAMDDAATALQQMKNSIGAAVAPLLQTLIPVLQVVVQWFITATNYVNQFLSLLRGQATWSRALPEPASAFEKTTKAAKGTAKAMKDLLADWDELNIIQSETGGNGSGGNQKSTQEYLNMFEEVDEYAQEIKDAIKFIDDTFGGILPLLKKIGIAILGWKFGRQFSGLLGALGKFVAGGAMITIGLELGYGTGFDIGMKGTFDGMDFLKLVGGSIASALGGYLMFGTTGMLIALTAYAVTTIVGIINGNNDALDREKWGDVEYTKEQIEEYVKKQFTFPVDAEIEVIKAHIDDEAKAKKAVDDAVKTFSDSLTDAEKVVADVDTTKPEQKIAAVKKAAEDAKATIEAVKALIETNTEGLTYTLTNFKFTNEAGEDITDDLLNSINVSSTTLRDYFTDIGKQLANLMLQGEKSGWKNGEMEAALELMASQKRIYDRAEELMGQMKFETEVAAELKGIIDRDTAVGIMQEQQAKLDEYKDTVKEMLKQQVDDMIYLAALAQSASEAAFASGDTENGSKLLETAQTYRTKAEELIAGIDDAVEDKLKDTKANMAKAWAETLKVVYGEDYLNASSYVTDYQTGFGAAIDQFIDSIFGTNLASYSTKDKIKKYLEKGTIDELAEVLYQDLYTTLGEVDPSGITKFYLDTLGGSLKDILEGSALQQIADNIVKNTEDKGLAFEIFKKMFKMTEEEARRFIDPTLEEVKDVTEREIKEVVAERGITTLAGGFTVDMSGGVRIEGEDVVADEVTDIVEEATESAQTWIDAHPLEFRHRLNASDELNNLKRRARMFKDTNPVADTVTVDNPVSGIIEKDYDILPEEQNVEVNVELVGDGAKLLYDFFDLENGQIVLHDDLDSSVDRDTEMVIRYLTNAINSLYNNDGSWEEKYNGDWDKFAADTMMETINQLVFDRGPEAWGKAMPYIDMLMDAYHQLNPDNLQGAIRPLGMVANAGFVSDVNFVNRGVTGSSAAANEAQTEDRIVTGVSTGVRNGNAEISNDLRTVIQLMRQWLQKEFTVNVAPSSAWGSHNSKSAEFYAKAWGEEP